MSVKVMSMVYTAHFHDITFIHKGRKKATDEEYEKKIKVLNSNLKSVCLALADHANDEGEGSYPSVDTLASKTELSEVTIITCLKGMRQEQIISYKGRSKWNTCNYTINKPKIAEMETWERQKREKPETKAALVSKVKPLQPESKAALYKPSIHPKPSSEEEDTDASAFQFFSENFGAITPFQAQLLGDLCDEHTPHWTLEAMKISVGRGARNLNFVKAILSRWKTDGYGTPQPKQTRANGNGKQPTKNLTEDDGFMAELERKRARLAQELNT